MGSWEIQPNPKGAGQVMRQMSTVWPACWGYSCSGPTTYFAPQTFNDTIVSVDVMLEDDGEWILNQGDKINPSLHLSTSGNWTFGKYAGVNSPFGRGTWHRITYAVTSSWQAASVDGTVLANSSRA